MNTPLFFLTFHDEAGNRVDDDADFPLTEAQLNAYLAGCDPTEFVVRYTNEPLVRDPNGELLVSFSEIAQ